MPSVAITGTGVISAIGLSPEPFWRSLLAGEIGMRPIPAKTGEGPYWRPYWWSPVKDSFDLRSFVDDPRLGRRTDRFAQYALAAALGAVQGAEFAPPERTAVVVGTSRSLWWSGCPTRRGARSSRPTSSRAGAA